MDKYYLSSNIYYCLKRKKYFFEGYEITNDNWKQYFSEYDIYDIPEIWNDRLENIENIGIKDCGADGDCLFNVIAEALNIYELNNDKYNDIDYYDSEHIRNMAAECITDENFELILNCYKAEYGSSFFMDDWNPLEIESKEQLQEIIKTEGNLFWGDHLVLELLQNKLEFNIIILKDDEDRIYPTANDINRFNKTIIIYYIDDIHFQLLTQFNEKLITIFDDNNPVPDKIIKVYNIDTNS